MRIRYLGWRGISLALAATAVLYLTAAAAGWHIPGVYRKPDNWTEVRKDWLYRSAQIPRYEVEDVLRKERIDLVLDLTDATPDPRQDAERDAATRLGVRYLHLPVQHPRDRVITNLAAAVTEIDRAHRRGERVLVHCTYGHRRSAAAVAIYARLIEQEPAHVAFAEFTRFAEADSDWSGDALKWLDKNMDEIAARVRADEAAADASAPIASSAPH